MASLPSGSRRDIELVSIETEKFSLLIKGKPYHEKYEGFRQYQQLDFHDAMNFDVQGEGIEEIRVFDVNKKEMVSKKEAVSLGDLRPIFFENGIYQLLVIPKNNEALSFYHEHPLLRQAVGPEKIGKQTILMGNLQFQNEVGLTTFEIREGNETVLEVTLEIFPVKLDYKQDYKKLIEEVNDEIYNLAYHFIKKTYQKAGIKHDERPSPTEFFRLISHHFQDFLHALKRIELQPHRELRKVYEHARGDQLRKLDSYGRSYLRKRAHLFADVKNGIAIHDRTVMPVKGIRLRKELTHDTLENRFVKWMIERLTHKLTGLLEAIERKNEPVEPKPNEELIAEITGMKKKLEKKLQQSFWQRIGKLDRSVMSLVLQMAPGYRDAFQIYLTVSKGLVLNGLVYRMSLKDVAQLYEYWTFLKLGQILARKYTLVSQDIVQVRRDGLFVNLDSNQQAQRVFRHPVTNEEIILTYQKSESLLPTVSQKPDTTLSIEKKGKDYKYDYIFDAKYRIDYAQEGSSYKNKYLAPGPMEEDINTMHRYRDAIVAANDGPYERTAFGAYVLFPWNDEDSYQEHLLYKSIDKVNIGGLPFLPNATDLVERFVERLIDKNPEELQKEGILPIGTLEEWRSSLEEMVLVGLVADEEDYVRFKQNRYYALEERFLRKGWQEAKYVALYVKHGVAKENGVTLYGRISDVRWENQHVHFEVEHWTRLSPVIKPVHYGIATYMMTTLNHLKEAKELPELFMKSRKEMALWRTLRRVSDQIKLELDAINVDQATKIKKYHIEEKDISFMIEGENLVILKPGKRSVLPLKTLKNHPSAVFKQL